MRSLTQPRRPFPLSYWIGRITWASVGKTIMWAVAIFAVLLLVTHIAPQVLGWGDGWR